MSTPFGSRVPVQCPPDRTGPHRAHHRTPQTPPLPPFKILKAKRGVRTDCYFSLGFYSFSGNGSPDSSPDFIHVFGRHVSFSLVFTYGGGVRGVRTESGPSPDSVRTSIFPQVFLAFPGFGVRVRVRTSCWFLSAEFIFIGFYTCRWRPGSPDGVRPQSGLCKNLYVWQSFDVFSTSASSPPGFWP